MVIDYFPIAADPIIDQADPIIDQTGASFLESPLFTSGFLNLFHDLASITCNYTEITGSNG